MSSLAPQPGRPEAAAAIWRWREAERAPRASEREAAARARRRGVVQGASGLLFGLAIATWLSAPMGAVVIAIGATILAAACVSPAGLYAGIDRLFAAVARALGRVVNGLLLVPVFFLFFLPFGRILRRGRRDRLQRYFDPSAKTYWEPREGPRVASESRRVQY